MPIAINGSGTVTGISTGGISDTKAVADAAMPAGAILQVVSTDKTTAFTTTSNSFVDVTGLSVSITPSSSSNKILVFIDLKWGQSTDDGEFFARAVRDSTAVFVGTGSTGNRTPCFFGIEDTNSGSRFQLNQASAVFLDSPNTTSSTTYKVQVKCHAASGQTIPINRVHEDTNHNYNPAAASSITVMEVAA
tara:strand:+ start:22 stop:594 length:573 start_codon:yes stop_codon:yes gene_type:complete